MNATLPLLEKTLFPALKRGRLDTLQVNLGYRCNQSCLHCHVNAGPNRTEMMDDATLALIPQVLAARHRMVLHPVADPVHVTTARRLRQDIAAGQRNLVVMLGGAPALEGLDDWSIWWGANLGADSEELVAGRVAEVSRDLTAARERARASAGWVMDIALLRAPDGSAPPLEGGAR